jgi:hypothetical protein
LAWARIRFGGPDLRPLFSTGIRALAAAVIAGWAASRVLTALGEAQILALVLGGSVFVLVVSAASWGLGDQTMRDALGRGIARLAAGFRGSRSRRAD